MIQITPLRSLFMSYEWGKSIQSIDCEILEYPRPSKAAEVNNSIFGDILMKLHKSRFTAIIQQVKLTPHFIWSILSWVGCEITDFIQKYPLSGRHLGFNRRQDKNDIFINNSASRTVINTVLVSQPLLHGSGTNINYLSMFMKSFLDLFPWIMYISPKIRNLLWCKPSLLTRSLDSYSILCMDKHLCMQVPAEYMCIV